MAARMKHTLNRIHDVYRNPWHRHLDVLLHDLRKRNVDNLLLLCDCHDLLVDSLQDAHLDLRLQHVCDLFEEKCQARSLFLPIRAKRKRRSLLVKLASWRTPSIICSTASSKSTKCQLTTIERSELVQETTDTRPRLRRTGKFVNANLFETVFNLRMDLVISVWSLFAVSSCEEPDAVDTQDIESHHLPHQRFPLAIHGHMRQFR